jgi:hypothetical protein
MRTWCAVVVIAGSTAVASADAARDAVKCDGGDAKACERGCKAKDVDGVSCTERGLLASAGKTSAAGKPRFEAGCAAGETYSCKLVAQIAEKAAPQDLALAAATYRKACDLGSETACARIGMSREEKTPAVAYSPRLVDAIRTACTAKHLPSCTEMGALYITGRGVAKDESIGLAAFDSACAAGELWACSNLGIQFGGKQDTAKQGADSLDKACTAGIAHACFNLGLQLFESQFLPHDKARGVALFDRACTLGQVMGCTALGKLYIAGDTVGKDTAKGEKLYAKACAALSASGCVELGRLHDGDHGAPADKLAIDAYTTACNRGHSAGCTGLAIMYHQGRAVPVDLAKARELYERACDRKNGTACNNLGVFYAKGTGGAKDEMKARAFYKLGCELENAEACVNHANATDSRAPLQKGCDADGAASCRELGNWMLHGTNGTTDRTRGLDLLDKGCKLGSQASCTDAAAARR